MESIEYPVDIQIRATNAPWYRGIELLVMAINPITRRRSIANDLTFTEVEPGTRTDSTLVLERDFAQTLMDDLWQCGLRPTEGIGSAGALRATEKHLEDMRAIALGLLKEVEVKRNE